MSLSRRNFLATGAATTLGFAGLSTLMMKTGYAVPAAGDIAEGFGPLLPDRAGILDLPKGFSYTVFSKKGDTMTDGFFVPGKPDGMAAFAGPNGKTILIRNHELDQSDPEEGPFGSKYELLGRLGADRGYDMTHRSTPCLGGTTTIVYDTATGKAESQYLSLACTMRNCAGGPTPWNSWITCEETTVRKDDTFAKDHGYNFEVPASAAITLADPIPLMDMGRFNHEAIAVDPKSGIVYETEDRGESCIYRFLPNAPGKLAAGGKLQALAVAGADGLDTRNWESVTVTRGATMTVRWIDCDDIQDPDDTLRLRMVEKGAAFFARGEGMWTGTDGIYFACTNGGTAQKGQIFRYVPSPNEGQSNESDAPGTLELFVEPNNPGLIDNADNLTVAPWGDLIVCEDGSGEQFLVGITPTGGIYKFARNAKSSSELAGSCFSPDGTTLFVNIQHDGLTLAITGPWNTAKA